MKPLSIALAAACLLTASPIAAQTPGAAAGASPAALTCADLLAMEGQRAAGAVYFVAGWRLGRVEKGPEVGAPSPGAPLVPAGTGQASSTARLENDGAAGAPIATPTQPGATGTADSEAETAAVADSESSRGPADEVDPAETSDAKADVLVTDKGKATTPAPDAGGAAVTGGTNAPPASPAVPPAAAPVAASMPGIDDIPVDRVLALCRDDSALSVGEALDAAAR